MRWCSLLLLLTTTFRAATTTCPRDPATKAHLAPVVFHGRLLAVVARRGGGHLATFRVGKVFKGALARDAPAAVEFPARGRCPRGPSPLPMRLEERYVVFAAHRRKARQRMVAFAEPEPYSKRKAVSRILCADCAKAPSVRGLRDKQVRLHAKLKLRCRLSGNPPPRIVWFMDGLRIQTDGRIKVRSKRRYSQLVINRVSSSDAGQYECRASNILGNATMSATVRTMVITSTDSTLWPFKRAPCPKRSFCLNGGQCSYYEVVGEYVCECAEGYRGQRCESKAISTLSNLF